VGYLPKSATVQEDEGAGPADFPGQLHGLDEATARSRSVKWCERMQITEAIEKKTEELSKGHAAEDPVHRGAAA